MSRTLSLVAGVLAVVATAVAGSVPLPGIGGLIILGVGLRWGVRILVTVGTAGLFVGVLAAGLVSGTPIALLVATAATVLAWDLGEYAITTGHRLGQETETTRVETVHAGASVLVAVGAVGVGTLVFRGTPGGQPTVVLVSFLGAGLLVLVLLTRQAS